MARQPNPWDRPESLPDSENPDSTPDELYFAIGKALAGWSAVEHELCLLFVALFSGKQGYGAYKVYGALPSTAARLSALKVAAEAIYTEKPAYAAYAKAVLGLTEKFLARRNDIAHGLIAYRESSGRATLMEPHYNIKHSSIAKNYEGYEFEARHILGYAESFHDLKNELQYAWTLLLVPVRRGRLGVRPSADTSLTIHVEPSRTALARKLAGLKPLAASRKSP